MPVPWSVEGCLHLSFHCQIPAAWHSRWPTQRCESGRDNLQWPPIGCQTGPAGRSGGGGVPGET